MLREDLKNKGFKILISYINIFIFSGRNIGGISFQWRDNTTNLFIFNCINVKWVFRVLNSEQIMDIWQIKEKM